MYNDYLTHHGIKGQKWGIRRYQNDDGTLTEEGKKRYGNSPLHERPLPSIKRGNMHIFHKTRNKDKTLNDTGKIAYAKRGISKHDIWYDDQIGEYRMTKTGAHKTLGKHANDPVTMDEYAKISRDVNARKWATRALVTVAALSLAHQYNTEQTRKAAEKIYDDKMSEYDKKYEAGYDMVYRTVPTSIESDAKGHKLMDSATQGRETVTRWRENLSDKEFIKAFGKK